MELFKGRPETTEGRLDREVRTYDYLDRLGIAYVRTDHEPANNMEACNEIDAVLGVAALAMCALYVLQLAKAKKNEKEAK